MMIGEYVVITRSVTASETFAKQLESLGLHTLYCPSIAFTKNLSSEQVKKYLSDIPSYDWILFSSSNGVKFFIDSLQEVGGNISLLKNIKIAAVGQKTAATAKTYDLSVSFIPSIFTAEDLAKELPHIQGKNILLPRSTIGNPELKTQLEVKGATVTDMPVYKTEHLKKEMTQLRKLLQKNQILCLTFTSPSTIEGFLKNTNKTILSAVLSLPVVSIGPITTKAAKKYGFSTIYTADTHTIEGMLMKLKEIVL